MKYLNFFGMTKYISCLIVFSFMSLALYGQDTRKISGKVTDYLTSQPVAKASITVKGSALYSAEASDEGAFEIEVPSLFSVLVISFPGYQTKNYALSGNEVVAIDIVPEGYDVGESVVRLPYNTFNEKDLNGVYRVVSEGYDNTFQYRDIYQMLQGRVAGLQAGTYSGVPGEGAMLNLGGIRSLYAGNEPLLVVDGLQVTDPLFSNSVARGNVYNYLSDINVKDIESVTLLRDASAAGIYGSRASNGAIIITTKGGTRKTFFDVSMQQGMSFRVKPIPVLNASEYMVFLSGRIDDQGLDQETIDELFPFYSNTNTNTVDYWRYANNTNWQKEVTRNAFSQDYYMNLRGGDATSMYSFNVGYNNMDGVGRGISAGRLTSRFNLDFNISKKLSAGTRIAFSRTIKELMDQGFEERVNPLYLSLIKPPILAPYEKSAQGVTGPFYDQPSFDMLSNPVAVINGVSNEVKNNWLLGSVYAQYMFNDALTTKIVFGLDRRNLEEDRFTPSNGIVPADFNPFFDRTSEEQMINRNIVTVEHTLSYDKQLNPDNMLTAFGGYNIELSNYSAFFGSSIHSSSDDFQGLGDGQKLLMTGADETVHNISAFLNADYSYKAKLLIKAGLRADASSKFGPDADAVKLFSVPVALLPYAGLTWKLKGEGPLNDLAFLNEFNLRASWGITANQNLPVNARYSLYSNNFYTTNPGITPAYLGNKSIKWETTYIYNAGLDISILRKALEIHLDYFNTKTVDLLIPEILDGSNGFNYFWSNNGTIRNHGIELGLNTFGNSGEFIWNIGVNIAKYVNEISDLPYGLPILDGLYGYTNIAQEGKAAGLIYGYQTLGVFSTDAQASASGLSDNLGMPYSGGDYHYSDLNGDKIINELDMKVIGDPNPDFFGGITANLSYGNFNVNANLSYSYGNDVLNVLRSKLENGTVYENQSVRVLSRWNTNGDITDVPYSAYTGVVAAKPASSSYIEDGSYLKLRSLTLSYNIEKRISFIRNAQIYITGYNLLTISDYLGWDPEVSTGTTIFSRGYDFGNYPQPKMVMLGIKVGL